MPRLAHRSTLMARRSRATRQRNPTDLTYATRALNDLFPERAAGEALHARGEKLTRLERTTEAASAQARQMRARSAEIRSQRESNSSRETFACCTVM